MQQLFLRVLFTIFLCLSFFRAGQRLPIFHALYFFLSQPYPYGTVSLTSLLQ